MSPTPQAPLKLRTHRAIVFVRCRQNRCSRRTYPTTVRLKARAPDSRRYIDTHIMRFAVRCRDVNLNKPTRPRPSCFRQGVFGNTTGIFFHGNFLDVRENVLAFNSFFAEMLQLDRPPPVQRQRNTPSSTALPSAFSDRHREAGSYCPAAARYES